MDETAHRRLTTTKDLGDLGVIEIDEIPQHDGGALTQGKGEEHISELDEIRRQVSDRSSGAPYAVLEAEATVIRPAGVDEGRSQIPARLVRHGGPTDTAHEGVVHEILRDLVRPRQAETYPHQRREVLPVLVLAIGVGPHLQAFLADVHTLVTHEYHLLLHPHSRRSPAWLRWPTMKTVVLGPRPEALESYIQRRRALGLDTFDEIWEGSYHMAPAAHPSHGYVDHALAVLLDPFATVAGLVATGPFNLGSIDDYRVPDHGYHRRLPHDVWVPTVALVVEVVSPDDETFAKFDFYAAHGVEEIIVADPASRTVRCFRSDGARYVETSASDLLKLGTDEMTAGIRWPPQT